MTEPQPHLLVVEVSTTKSRHQRLVPTEIRDLPDFYVTEQVTVRAKVTGGPFNGLVLAVAWPRDTRIPVLGDTLGLDGKVLA